MNNSVWIMIAGMTLVTYLPGMLPSVIIDKVKIPSKVDKFLKMIPYTAMAALIFSGILTVDESYPVIGFIGRITAGIHAWEKPGL